MKDIQVNTNPTLSRKEFYAELLEQVQSICEDQTFWVKKKERTTDAPRANLIFLCVLGD